jgi:transcriptional regulator with XRE-family HTH domain
MAMDSPLRRWRRKHGITQEALGERCGVTKNTIARWEQGFRLPGRDALMRLVEITGLSAEALVYPARYLEEHPTFLVEWAEQPPRRGRQRERPESS